MTSRASHRRTAERRAFTLIEVVTSLAILGLLCSSVMVVMTRCTGSAYDVAMRLKAIEVARENMEAVISAQSVEEGTEFGTSEKYPAIHWETTVETFVPDLSTKTWVRAVCAAEYEDLNGEIQRIELEDWLTDVTDAQMQALEGLTEVFETMEEAAEYAGVDEETITAWVDNGMVQTEDGGFLRENLDLYKRTDGNPSQEEKDQQPNAPTVRGGSQGGESDDPSQLTPEEVLKMFQQQRGGR